MGIDIGWAVRKRTNAVCRFDWNSKTVRLEIARSNLSERPQVLQKISDRPLLVAAFDGPLRGDLRLIGHYRLAEKLLTGRLKDRIGKPGQSNSPNGKLLNSHANTCAEAILKFGVVCEAAHAHAIHNSAIVEAFPTSFLGVLIDRPELLKTKRKDRSDIFYSHLAHSGGLLKLLKRLLPGRNFVISFEAITHHDETAAVICGLTALCVAAGDYTVVGDKEDGWIVLPPCSVIRPWAQKMLSQNAQDCGGGLEFSPALREMRVKSF